jgi:hypothetical protein
VLVDSNQTNINKANDLGIEGYTENIYSETLSDNVEFNDIGYLLALTGNSEINDYAVDKFGAQFGENGSFRLVSNSELGEETKKPSEGLFSHTDDYVSFSQVTEKHPEINEIKVNDKKKYLELLEGLNKDEDQIPLFLKDAKGEIHILSSLNEAKLDEVAKKSTLVYLGKPN